MKEWFKKFLSGIGIGIGSGIPGVSGGTVAVIFNVYEKFIWSISNLFKHFKEAFKILLPIVLGIVIGVIPTIILMDKALANFLFGIVCVFAGFIVGSIPKLTKEVKDVSVKAKHIIALVAAFLIAAGLGIASVVSQNDVGQFFTNTPIWFYFVLIPVGVVASFALVVPGISGSMMLVLLGFYTPLIESTVATAKNCLAGDWSNFGNQITILGCFAIGVIVGFFFISKLMSFLLSKYRDITFFAIIGFVVGSVIALFINFDIWKYYELWAAGAVMPLKKEIEIPLGIALFIIFIILSYLLTRLEAKYSSKEEPTDESKSE